MFLNELRLTITWVVVFAVLIPTRAFSNQEAVWSPATCFSVEDMKSAVHIFAEHQADQAKILWDSMKASGKCLFNIQKSNSDPIYETTILNNDIDEEVQDGPSGKSRIVYVREKMLIGGKWKEAYTFYEIMISK